MRACVAVEIGIEIGVEILLRCGRGVAQPIGIGLIGVKRGFEQRIVVDVV